MNNSINLTLDEQFDKDCKVIKLKYEYPGYTGEEKWAIITGLTEEELNEKYAEKTASLRPFIVLDLAFGKARTKFINNENKHYMRGVRSIEPFDYDDELLTAHHPELVVDSFEESFLRNEEMLPMPLSKRGILVRFASEEQSGFQKEVLMPGLMKIANPVKYAMTTNRIINKTSAFEYHIAKRSSLAI